MTNVPLQLDTTNGTVANPAIAANAPAPNPENELDHNGQTAEQKSSGADMGGISNSVNGAMQRAAEELGIPPKYAQWVMDKLGIGGATAAMEVLMAVMNNFDKNKMNGATEIADTELSHLPAPNLGVEKGPVQISV